MGIKTKNLRQLDWKCPTENIQKTRDISKNGQSYIFFNQLYDNGGGQRKIW